MAFHGSARARGRAPHLNLHKAPTWNSIATIASGHLNLQKSATWNSIASGGAPHFNHQNSSSTFGSRESVQITPSRDSRRIESLLVTSSRDLLDCRPSAFIVRHWLFRSGINLVVLLGVIQLGLEVEFSGPEFEIACKAWSIFYTVISTMEMVFMIEAYRCKYFQKRWLLLDFGVGVASILDTIIFLATDSADVVEVVSFLRLLRVLRILKVTRVFPGFAVIMEGLLQSFQSMFWIFGLLVLILYAGSICCVSVLGGPRSGFPDYNEDSVRSVHIEGFNNYEYFGTLFRSMISLLSMLLLSEWYVVRTIAEVHVGMVPLFLLLLVLVTFGVTNVIIGIVVEKTTLAMNIPAEEELSRQIEFKAEMAVELGHLLYDIDVDGDELISLDELEQGLQRPELAAKLKSLDLPYGFKASELLLMLDLDGDGQLSEHEFVVGLLRLISSNEWQRQCLYFMEFGMLHNTMVKLGNDLKTELKNSVRAIQSEIRILKSNIELKSRQGYSDPGPDQAPPVDAQFSRALWEPLPKAPAMTIAGRRHGIDPLPQTECLPSDDLVDGDVQLRSFEDSSPLETTIKPHVSSSPKQVPPSETKIRPHVAFSINQVPPSETMLIPQPALAENGTNSHTLDCWSRDGGCDVMAAPGDKTQMLPGLGEATICDHVQPHSETAGIEDSSMMTLREFWI